MGDGLHLKKGWSGIYELCEYLRYNQSSNLSLKHSAFYSGLLTRVNRDHFESRKMIRTFLFDIIK